MNLNKVDKTWNEFSELKNIGLKYKERKQDNVTQSHYLINYSDEIATFSFIGVLWKSLEDLSTDKTTIIIEFNNRLAMPNFELKISIETVTEFENNILKSLKKFKGNSITLKDNFVRIDTEHIFSTIEEFKLVIEFISKLKTT